MKKFSLICLAIMTLVAVAQSNARSATIALYDFNGFQNHFNTTSTNGGNHVVFAPTTTASGVTATNLSATGGGTTNGVRLGNNSFGGAEQYPLVNQQVLLVGTSGTSAEALNDYFSITITPDSGSLIDFENLTLQGARGGGSARGFTVRSSIDGFGAKLNGPETEAVASQRPSLTNYTIDLSADPFNSVTGPIEFRFYAYSNFKDNTVEIDNLSFNGEVLAVPEAASLSLLLVGLIGIGAKRNR